MKKIIQKQLSILCAHIKMSKQKFWIQYIWKKSISRVLKKSIIKMNNVLKWIIMAQDICSFSRQIWKNSCSQSILFKIKQRQRNNHAPWICNFYQEQRAIGTIHIRNWDCMNKIWWIIPKRENLILYGILIYTMNLSTKRY